MPWLLEGLQVIPLAALPMLPLSLSLLTQSPRGSGAQSSLSPEQLFQKVSPSVVVVERLDGAGERLGRGSGVVIGDGMVVTNHHVIKGAAALRIRHKDSTWVATPLRVSPEHDVAGLIVHGLHAPAVRIRQSNTLRVGERVYAVGTPRGLELTLSEGLISGLRPVERAYLVQTTAPISPGSSGGGLFDARGDLVGLTTESLLPGESQNLNFARPAEWALDMVSSPRGIAQPLPLNPSDQNFLAGLEAFQRQDWAGAVSAFRQSVRVSPSDYYSWVALSNAYSFQGLQGAPGVTQHFENAAAAARAAVRLKPDSAEPWLALGIALMYQDKNSEAIEAFQSAKDRAILEGWEAAVFTFLSEALRRDGRTAEALDVALTATRVDPAASMTWRALARACAAKGDIDQQITAWQRFSQLQPGDFEASLALGTALLLKGRAQESITLLRDATRLQPSFADAWVALGHAYSAVGLEAGVRECYDHLRSLDPVKAEEFQTKVSRNVTGVWHSSRGVSYRIESRGDQVIIVNTTYPRNVYDARWNAAGDLIVGVMYFDKPGGGRGASYFALKPAEDGRMAYVEFKTKTDLASAPLSQRARSELQQPKSVWIRLQ